MVDDFEPLALDPAAAYGGVVGSMEEQFEKVSLAQTGQDESRYAQHTLGDMRANLEGGEVLYQAFRPWLTSKDGGAELDTKITARFGEISDLYGEFDGDAIPPVPPTWNPDAPTDADLATDYGRLYDRLSQESDPANADGLVSLMLQAAELMGIVL
jgi:iron uptake system component EfeO